ncbi:MAG: hypothetical protein JNK97_14240 [Zoogloea sp.]|nr:hypothetical protein [Zoogloea sp.]
MPEIDLIPATWRARRRARRSLRRGGLVITALVLGIGATRVGLELSTRSEQGAVQHIQAARRDGEREAARLTALLARRSELQHQQALIDTLRGGRLVGDVLQPLDRALDDGLWFDELQFFHPTTLPQPGSPPAVAESSLGIRGKATDTAAVGRFMDALAQRGPCLKPALTPGETRRYTRFELVDFVVSCPLRPGPAGE